VAGLPSKIRNRALESIFPWIFRIDQKRTDLIRLGSEYGGWWVPESLLGAESICYTAGVGTDISFDIGLVEHFECHVYGIDPTPVSVEWIENQETPSKFSFVEIGLSGHAGDVRFYSPLDSRHASFSTKNLQRTDHWVTARAQTVSGLMGELGHGSIDLLKLDIEGAEHETLESMIADGVRPGVICVEYDQPEPPSWGLKTTRKLRQSGYDLVKVEGFNLTFVAHSANL
jgi:FkbM family methyltransferase